MLHDLYQYMLGYIIHNVMDIIHIQWHICLYKKLTIILVRA